jgi:hypothetical protein
MAETVEEYGGDDRRLACRAHEQNTKDIAGLKATGGTNRWIIQIALPLLLVVFSAFATLAYNGLKDTLKEIQVDVRGVKAVVDLAAVSNAVTRTEVEQLKKDVAELKSRVGLVRDDDHRTYKGE